MHLSNPYSPFLFFSAVIALVLAGIAWRRRTAPGAVPFFLMLVVMAVRAGSDAFMLEARDAGWELFWFNAALFGSAMSVPALWAFGVQFSGRGRWLTLRSILIVSIIPVLAVLLGWTTERHGLFYAVRDLGTVLSDGRRNVQPGVFYWVHIAYAYSTITFTIWLLARAYLEATQDYRRQVGALLLGTLIPFAGNIVYTLFIGVDAPGADPTPFLFTVMGVFYAYGLFWERLFDLVPVARHMLVEHMQDGVIVIDSHNRIVDVNPSALRWLDWKYSSPVGRDVRELLQSWLDQFDDFPMRMYVETEVHSASPNDAYFDLRVEPLLDEQGRLTGRLIVFRDITRQKMTEQAFRGAHDRLRLHVKEIQMLQAQLREQAIRDPLTGLFNRRYLEETLSRELARAARGGTSLGICMADIDRFKSFNDQHGHQAGDLILKMLAEILSSFSRAEDVVCRYGGEEFLILLPGADMDVTMRRAEDWRRAFEQTKLEFEGESFSTTLSLGVAVFPQHGATSDELLKRVDEALYLSKRNGRNRVSVAQSWGGGGP